MCNKNYSDIFECNMCGKCCYGYGGTYISTSDAKNISRFLKIQYLEFVSQYTQLSGNRIILSQKEDGFCIFWNKQKACLIHPVKPDMCRKWPFISSILKDFQNWNIISNSCPGIKSNIAKNKIISYIKTS